MNEKIKRKKDNRAKQLLISMIMQSKAAYEAGNHEIASQAFAKIRHKIKDQST